MYMHVVVSVLRENKGQNNLTKGDIDKHRIYIRNLVDIFCRLSTMHERDKQTGHGTVVSIAVAKSLSAMSPNNNKYINLYSAKLPVFRCVGVKCFQFPVNVRYAENTSCSCSTLSLHFCEICGDFSLASLPTLLLSKDQNHNRPFTYLLSLFFCVWCFRSGKRHCYHVATSVVNRISTELTEWRRVYWEGGRDG